MPTYKMTAPNGQTYSIDGPANASDDDVRTAILSQHPDAGSAPAPKDANAFAKAGRIMGDEYQAGSDQYRASIKAAGAKAASGQPLSLTDMVAPIAAAYRAVPGALFKGVADSAFGDKPIAPGVPVVGNMTGGDVAQMAVPFVGEAGKAVAAVPKVAESIADALNGTKNAISNVAGAGTRAATASDAMRAEAATNFGAAQDTAATQASADADRATRAAALAQRAKARQAILASRQADAASAAAPPELNVGTPAHLSDIGDQVRQPALAAQSDIESGMQAADAQHRSAMQAVAAEQAANGVGVSDMPTAKALINKSEALVNPDPATRPNVGTNLANNAGGSLHKELLEALKPQVTPLTPEQAAQATKNGITVETAPDGSFFSTNKPDLTTVDNFRRRLGDLMNPGAEGYSSLIAHEAGQMRTGVSQAMDEYAKGTSAPVQANWKAGKAALAPFEQVRAGRGIVGMQTGTDVPAVPAANIPSRIIAGGRDTVQQASAVAGPKPISNALRSIVQNKLSGVTGSDAIAAKVGPGTQLGDAIKDQPDLQNAVQEYLAKTKAAEASSAQAVDLGQRASTNAARAQRYSDYADALNGTSQKAAVTANNYARSLANLEIAAPKDVGSMYSSMLEDAHKNGTISIAKYADGQQLAANAEKDFALKATRDKWLKSAAAALGIGALTREGYSMVTNH